MGFWSGVGHVFVGIGKGAVAAAKWSSQNPQLLGAVATMVGHPEITAAITAIELAKRGAQATQPATPAVPGTDPAPVQAPPPEPVKTNSETWGPFIIEAYRTGQPAGLNRFPEPTEVITDADTIARKEAESPGSGQKWLRHEMYQRNGLKEYEMPADVRL